MYDSLPREWLLLTCRVRTLCLNSAGDTKRVEGSGFFCKNNKGDFVLVTNRHVIDIGYGNDKYTKHGYKLNKLESISIDGDGNKYGVGYFNPIINVPKNNKIDIATINLSKCSTFDISTLSQPAFLPNWINYSLLADKDYINNQLEWGAQITFPSFQPWRDVASERAIIRTGIIASDPKFAFKHPEIEREEIFLLEAFSFAGSSGSPVFANPRGIKLGPGLTGGEYREQRLIGIMCGHIKNSGDGDTNFTGSLHTGLSYCHKSDWLLRMLNEDSDELTIL
jgi:hypothetical protein